MDSINIFSASMQEAGSSCRSFLAAWAYRSGELMMASWFGMTCSPGNRYLREGGEREGGRREGGREREGKGRKCSKGKTYLNTSSNMTSSQFRSSRT